MTIAIFRSSANIMTTMEQNIDNSPVRDCYINPITLPFVRSYQTRLGDGKSDNPSTSTMTCSRYPSCQHTSPVRSQRIARIVSPYTSRSRAKGFLRLSHKPSIKHLSPHRVR